MSNETAAVEAELSGDVFDTLRLWPEHVRECLRDAWETQPATPLPRADIELRRLRDLAGAASVELKKVVLGLGDYLLACNRQRKLDRPLVLVDVSAELRVKTEILLRLDELLKYMPLEVAEFLNDDAARSTIRERRLETAEIAARTSSRSVSKLVEEVAGSGNVDRLTVEEILAKEIVAPLTFPFIQRLAEGAWVMLDAVRALEERILAELDRRVEGKAPTADGNGGLDISRTPATQSPPTLETLQATHEATVRILKCIEDIIYIGTATNPLALAGRIPLGSGKTQGEYVLERLHSLEEELTSHGDCIRNAWPAFSAAQSMQCVKLGNTRAESMHLAVVKLAQNLKTMARAWVAIIYADTKAKDAKLDEAELKDARLEGFTRPWSELTKFWPAVKDALQDSPNDDWDGAEIILRSEYANAVAANVPSNEPQPVDSNDEDNGDKTDGSDVMSLMRAMELAAPDSTQILKFAKDKSKSPKERYQSLVELDKRFAGYTSEDMADLLGCSDGRVRQIRKELKTEGSELYKTNAELTDLTQR